MFRRKETSPVVITHEMNETNDKIVRIFKQIFHMATSISSFDLKLTFFGDQIKDSSGDLKSCSSASAAAAEEISSSMEELLNINESFSDTLRQIARDAEVLNKNTQESNGLVQSIRKDNNDMLAFSEQMQHSMKELSDVITKAGQVIAGINKISSQTKLLSLNASIEAARAGESGKGFSVVAEKIKALSETTGQLTSGIDELLGQMQTALEQSMDSTRHASSSICNVGKNIETVADMLQKNTGAVEHITNSISSAASSGEQVNAAFEEASASLETVNSDLQDMSDSAEKLNAISHSIGDISNTAKSMEEDITNLAVEAGRLVTDGKYPLSNDDFTRTIRDAIQAHIQWVKTVSDMAASMRLLPLQTDEHKCGFGHFYFAVRPSAPELSASWDEIDTYHHKLHHIGEDVILSINKRNQAGALQAAKEAEHMSEQIIGLFEKINLEVQKISLAGKTVF